MRRYKATFTFPAESITDAIEVVSDEARLYDSSIHIEPLRSWDHIESLHSWDWKAYLTAALVVVIIAAIGYFAAAGLE